MNRKKTNFNPYIPCPCGSNLKAKFCCYIHRKWSKKPAKITIPDKFTESNAKCYARVLNNCSHKISKEHYISQVVQKQLEFEGGVSIFGLHFLGSQVKSLPISTLASNILCEAHNSALSPLDTVAGKFFQNSLEIATNYDNAPEISVFAGEDIELWMLKTLLGIASSKQTQRLNKKGLSKAEYFYSSDLIKILFQEQKWPLNWGLYVREGIFPSNGHLLIHLNEENNLISGAHFRFCGKEFFLNLGAKEISEHWFDFPKVNKSPVREYRPGSLSYIINEMSRKQILTWKDEECDSKSLTHDTLEYYHIPDSDVFPPQDLTPLLELMDNPRHAINKYIKP